MIVRILADQEAKQREEEVNVEDLEGEAEQPQQP